MYELVVVDDDECECNNEKEMTLDLARVVMVKSYQHQSINQSRVVPHHMLLNAYFYIRSNHS
jgi:hypothetical protein